MRCLYCGKQLALLKRLTGGGEFCSDAHKQSYQEEYNRLALSRLLQAQSKPGEIKTSAPKAPPPSEGLGQPLPPGAARRRALPASAPAPEPAPVAVRTGRVIYAPAAEEPVQPVVEKPAPVEIVETSVRPLPERPFAERPFLERPFEDTRPETAEEVPPEVTVFSMEIPASSAIADDLPYVEPWLEVAPHPATLAWPASAWQASGRSFCLPFGTLLSIAGPAPGGLEIPAMAAQSLPLDFAQASVDLSALSNRAFASSAPAYTWSEIDPLSTLPAAELAPLEICSASEGAGLRVLDLPAAPADFPAAEARRDVPFSATVTPARKFPAAPPIHLDIRVTASGAGHQTSSNGALRFPVRIAFQDSSLLNLHPSGIDFPAEDSDVVFIAPWAGEMRTHSNGHHAADEEALADSDNSSSPRQVLEALSKLHQDLADRQAAAEPASEPAAEPPGVDLELVGEPSAQNAIAAPEEPSAATLDISAEPSEAGPSEEGTVPRSAHDFFEIPWKTFAPPKPSLAVESKALVNLPPEMPLLKALPLRPKVAKAPRGFTPQSSSVQPAGTAPVPVPDAEPKAKTPGPPAAPPRPEARTSQIPAPPAKQPAASVKSPPTVQTVKPGQTTKPAQPVKPAQPAKPAQTAKPPQPPVPGKTTGTGTPAAPKQQAPAQSAVGGAGEAAKPLSNPAAKEKEQNPAAKPSEETVPSFASIQTGKNASFIGSLKGKLTIAILLIVGAGVVFYSVSNESHAPARDPVSSNEDAAGPSIMLGEGGWVQGWGGDPNGSNAGRQITIYRPSLKLNDYRIEFQGEIDSKSVGWVFRALDPYNYYAMKLAMVTPGLSPKLALIRYAVTQGREREMGRVPLDLAAKNDTVFHVRMDVRGSKFTTYLQGQQVDVWTDEQIKSGGVGFLNERAERARIKSATISYLTGGKN